MNGISYGLSEKKKSEPRRARSNSCGCFSTASSGYAGLNSDGWLPGAGATTRSGERLSVTDRPRGADHSALVCLNRVQTALMMETSV